MTTEDREREIERRTAVALEAIRGLADDQDSEVALFVSHHLEEVEAEYWLEQTGTEKPSAAQVLEILVMRHWGPDPKEDGGIAVFDFTLPKKTTNYVIAVYFDARGKIELVTMES